MDLRGIVVLALSLGLAACAAPQAAPAPTVTVTQTVTAEPVVTATPTPEPTEGADLSRYLYIACTAATQWEILWAIGDSVYFEQRISPLARMHTDWYLDVLREGANMDAGLGALSPEDARIVEEVAADLQEQAIFVEDMKRTDDYFTWYDTWMSVVEDPEDFESVQDLLSASNLYKCPLYPDANVFGAMSN